MPFGMQCSKRKNGFRQIKKIFNLLLQFIVKFVKMYQERKTEYKIYIGVGKPTLCFYKKYRCVMKIAFLDRDGTINADYHDNEWRNVEHPELLDKTIDGLKYIIKKGYNIIIITNQYIIGEKIITHDMYEQFNSELLYMLNKNYIDILDIFYCPHSRKDNCDCCKPKTGLIKQALSKYPEIDISNSFMCGDSKSDMECAKNAGLDFYGINIGDKQIKNLSELSYYF